MSDFEDDPWNARLADDSFDPPNADELLLHRLGIDRVHPLDGADREVLLARLMLLRAACPGVDGDDNEVLGSAYRQAFSETGLRPKRKRGTVIAALAALADQEFQVWLTAFAAARDRIVAWRASLDSLASMAEAAAGQGFKIAPADRARFDDLIERAREEWQRPHRNSPPMLPVNATRNLSEEKVRRLALTKIAADARSMAESLSWLMADAPAIVAIQRLARRLERRLDPDYSSDRDESGIGTVDDEGAPPDVLDLGGRARLSAFYRVRDDLYLLSRLCAAVSRLKKQLPQAPGRRRRDPAYDGTLWLLAEAWRVGTSQDVKVGKASKGRNDGGRREGPFVHFVNAAMRAFGGQARTGEQILRVLHELDALSHPDAP